MKFFISNKVTKNITALVIALQFLLVLSSFADSNQKISNTQQVKCEITPFKKSKIIIEAILDDLDSSYLERGGGGISEIKQVSTNAFTVSISQEERIDQFTYEVAVDNSCKVKILKRESSVISFKQ